MYTHTYVQHRSINANVHICIYIHTYTHIGRFRSFGNVPTKFGLLAALLWARLSGNFFGDGGCTELFEDTSNRPTIHSNGRERTTSFHADTFAYMWMCICEYHNVFLFGNACIRKRI